MNQAVGRGILEHAGATVDVANHGEEALVLLKAHTRPYSLVLMDVRMPVMDGLTGKSLDVDAMLATIAKCRVTRSSHQPNTAVTQGPSLVVFNPEPLLSSTGNNPATRAVVVGLCRELEQHGMLPLVTVQQYLQSGDTASACRLLHTLRGSLGSVGAKSFAATTLALEHAIRANKGTAWDALLSDVRIQLQQVTALAAAMSELSFDEALTILVNQGLVSAS